MSANRIVGWLIVVVLLGAAAYFLFPGFREKVDSTYDKHFGWTPEARKKDPVGFIEYSIKKLGDNVGKFEVAKGEYRVNQLKLEEQQKTNQEKVAFAEKQLDEFKATFKEAAGGKGWPASVAGRSYSESDLKSQVALLLSQKGSYEGILKQVEKVLGVTEKRRRELENRIAESKAKVDVLQAQKALVSVNQLSAETEKLLTEVNDVLIQNEALAESSSVRSLDDLMKEAADASGPASNPSVDAFLNS